MDDRHCEEFDEFCRQYGDDITTSILEDICCEYTETKWPFQLLGLRHETHDREGNNRTISGKLKFKARAWMFEVNSGNWNGTEIKSWERACLSKLEALPVQSIWLFASIEAIMVRMRVDEKIPVMAAVMERLMKRKEQ